MSKKIIIFYLFCLLPIEFFGQVINYALSNDNGTGKAETAAIAELDEAPEFTFQCWLFPSNLTKNITLFNQENLSILLDEKKQITIRAKDKIVTATYTGELNNWIQLTITSKNGTVKVFFNNEESQVFGSLDEKLGTSTGIATLFDGFIGSVDEIRIWNKALTSADFFWQNTINKTNQYYSSLIAYWKCDQNLCPDLVDYKWKYHARLINLSHKQVTNNEHFKYRVVTGYTNLQRFIDRPRIDRDMFLMTNDIILLSAKIQPDGSILHEMPDLSGLTYGVDYIADYKGHKGVMKFNGIGSKIESKEALPTPFDPITTNPKEASTTTATISGWFHVDIWNEGAELFSKYETAEKGLIIRLGKESRKEIVVEYCGATAILPNKLSVNNWHYIAVYLSAAIGNMNDPLTALFFNPISIGVDYVAYDKFNGIELSGGMNVARNPTLYNAKAVLGKNFNGKIDNLMIWGIDRKSAAKYDAENEYQKNSGNYTNIFLNAQWTGDRADNIGRDDQSLSGFIDYIRGYYKNHRGYKIRISLVEENHKWKEFFADQTILNRFGEEAKKLLEICDGIDVDLEWATTQQEFNVFNSILHKLADYSMAPYRGQKIFTVSLIGSSYSIDKTLIPKIDYFTFQIYGPHATSMSWQTYQTMYTRFKDYGFPADKTVLSYATLLVNPTNRGVEGYTTLFDSYGMNDTNFNPSLNEWNCAGVIKSFNGVNMVKQKQQLIIDNRLCGTMYFDMGNDQRVTSKTSLIRAQNEVIASNVDTVVYQVELPTILSVKKIKPSTNQIRLQFDASTRKLSVSITDFNNLTSDTFLYLIQANGKVLLTHKICEMRELIKIPDYLSGAAIVMIANKNWEQSEKIIII